MSLTQAIFDLAAHPEYFEILREEIKEVLAIDGYDVDGEGFVKLKKPSYTKLKKLDSFLKESQRLSPIGIRESSLFLPKSSACYMILTSLLVAMMRVSTSPIKLSTGHTLPADTHFACASHEIHRSTDTPIFSPSYNPASYTPPSSFDGLRFYKLRAMPGKENHHQFVTTAPDSLSFGHGIHACPGRFFASNEIKVVLIELLRNWGVRLVGDTERKGGARPPNSVSFTSILPDVTAQLEFKRLSPEECI